MHSSRPDIFRKVEVQAMSKDLFGGKTIKNIHKSEVSASSIDELFLKHEALQKMEERHHWTKDAVKVLLENTSQEPRDVQIQLEFLTKEDAVAIFEFLPAFIISYGSVSSGIAEWQLQYPAMKQLQTEQPWFFQLVDELSQISKAKVSLIMIGRLAFCVFLSYVDFVTDIYMAVEFHKTHQVSNARLTVVFPAFSLGLHCLSSVAQNIKNPWFMAKDQLFIVTLIKPAVNLKRIADGNRQEKHQIMSPAVENAISKIIVLTFEAAPAFVVQTAVLLTTPNPSSVPLNCFVGNHRSYRHCVTGLWYIHRP